MYLGDFSTGSTALFHFTTVNSSGAPAALSSAAVTVYQMNSTAANSTGVTLSASFDGRTGFNKVQVDMVTTSTFYLPGMEFAAVISSGGISSQDLAGYSLAHWSVIRGTPVNVSTAVNISTGSAIDSVTNVNSTVQSDVRLWKGIAPSTLGTNNHIVPSSTAAILSVTSVSGAVTISTASAIDSVTSVTNAVTVSTAVSISTASVIDSVGSVTSTVAADVRLWVGTAPSTLGTNSHLQISTASKIASASSVDTVGSVAGSVGSVASTVQADVALWRGVAPSTLGTNSHIQISTGSAITSVASIVSTVAADVNLWRGTAPSTLGTNGFLVPSSTAALLSVTSVNSTVDSHVRAIAGSTLAAENVTQSMQSVATFTVGVGSSSSGIVLSALNPASVVADQFKGRIVRFNVDTGTAALRGQETDILASSTAASPVLTVTPLTTAPASGDKGVML